MRIGMNGARLVLIASLLISGCDLSKLGQDPTAAAVTTTLTVSSSRSTTWTVNPGGIAGNGTQGNYPVTPGSGGTQYTIVPAPLSGFSAKVANSEGGGATLTLQAGEAKAFFITYSPVVPTVTLTASPTTIASGGVAMLTWTSTGADGCRASWSGGSVASSGSQPVQPASTANYSVVCTNDGGSATALATVAVLPPLPPALTLSATPATIIGGQATMLVWSSTHAESCSASWTAGNVDLSGTFSVRPVSSTTYSMICSGLGGATSKAVSVSVQPPDGPLVQVSAAPATINPGESASVVWHSTGATSCTALWSGSTLPVNGSEIVQPKVTTAYSVACAGPGGSMTGQASVTVLPPTPPARPTVSVSALPASITSGQSTTVTWASISTSTCVGSWIGGNIPLNGSQSFQPTSGTTYTVTCTGPGGSIASSASVAVQPVPPVPTITLTATPGTIQLGQGATLTWTSVGATSCNGSWIGTGIPLNGSAVVQPTSTTVYGVDCRGPGGWTSVPVIVTVTQPQPPAPTVTLGASPAQIQAGGTAFLTWSSTNATSCDASWTSITATGGNVGVMPSSTTTYSITCDGAGGTGSASVLVTVAALGTLDLTVNGLPAGASANITVNGPSFSGYVFHSDVLKNLGPGNYDILAVNVTVGSTIYAPVQTFQQKTVSAGSIATATVSYSSTTSPPPGITLSASPKTISAGQSSVLNWGSVNATSCTASWNPNIGISGSQTVSPIVSTTYSLTCTGPGGSDWAGTDVKVSGGSQSAATISVTSNLSTSWTISPGGLSGTGTSGSHAVSPSSGGTVYTIVPTSLTGYSLSVTSTGGGGSSLTLTPGANKAFTITYSPISTPGIP